MHKLEQRVNDSLIDDVIPAGGAVTSDVPQSPDGLLTDVRVGGVEQLHQQRHGSLRHYRPRLLGRARRNVCECPGSLKLEQRAVCAASEEQLPPATDSPLTAERLHQHWNYSSAATNTH